jgi:hypothetical protein
VNNETKVFNRKLLKLMKPYKHVLIVTVDTDSQFYTRYGLHVNKLDKEKIASKVSVKAKSIFQKQNVKINLFWKIGYDRNVKSVSGNPTDGTISLQEDFKTDQIPLENMEVPIAAPSSDEGHRMSKRKKKPPTTKSEDFLW